MKTIGDAVMATFETPDRSPIAAAIRMREATRTIFGAQRQQPEPAPEDRHP